MNEKQIFEHLFAIAAESKDPRGVVAACIVDGSRIIASAASGDDGYTHAEDIMFDDLKSRGALVPRSAILYVTLEPCSRRTDPTMVDCTTLILDNGVMAVVFGAHDPKQSRVTCERLKKAGVSLRQVSDPEIIRRCAEIFNKTVATEHIGNGVDLKPVG